ncbi:GntR family transcriptional regulator [Rhodovulum euryhalinum]|uniref:GntR family transcriptional regulator n=1 Tax=Rhodovulum euryhalinum TaxID=35805 RepID=A0A4R2KNB5_9RHOB|nr:GntR family transcriptional regulator [Rhodovulum euryhalinum]TCO74182.1 GntR family transcriptional regulator [Rhodovulum euryhalinum]
MLNTPDRAPQFGQPLRRESLQQQVYERLRHNLTTGVFKPGEILSSRSLAQELGVSAMPVREALTRLTAEGALELTSSRTLRVRLMTADAFDEVTAIRLDLEGMAAERAAGLATPDALATITRLHHALAEAAERGGIDDYLHRNAQFHDAIYAASGWPLLTEMIRRLWMIVGPSIRACVPDRAHMAVSMAHHDAVLAALNRGDGPGLRAAILADIGEAATDIRKTLTERKGETG